jgi:hypothetical protein
MAARFNKYQYVELQVNVGTANPNFTPQQYLKNRQVFAAEVFTSEDVNQSRSNLTLATPAMLQGMFLNLYCSDVNLPMQAIPNSSQYNGQGWGLWFRDVPLTALHRTQSGPVATGITPNVRDIFEMYGELIDFEQSYVNITPTSQALITDGGVPVVVLFGFGYK